MTNLKCKERLSSLFIILLMIFIPTNGISHGRFMLKSNVSSSWRIDDNLYKSETNKRGVCALLVEPDFELSFVTTKSLLSLNYTMSIYNYEDRNTLSARLTPAKDENFIGHIADVNFKTALTHRITLGIQESYIKTRDQAHSDTFSNSIERYEYYLNRVTPQLVYNLGDRFSAGLKYRYTETNYKLPRLEDSAENRAVIDFDYSFNKTTSFDIEYQYWERDYDLLTSDYKSNQAKIIITRQYKYLSVEGGYGYHYRNFKDTSPNHISAVIYHLSVSGRDATLSTENSKNYFSMTFESNFNDSGSGEKYFNARRLKLKMGHIFMDKLTLDLTGVYQDNEYKKTIGLTPSGTTKLRDDDLHIYEGSLGYIFNDYLYFKIITGREKRESNIVGMDYNNNYLAAKLNFGFDLNR